MACRPGSGRLLGSHSAHFLCEELVTYCHQNIWDYHTDELRPSVLVTQHCNGGVYHCDTSLQATQLAA